MNTNGKLKTCPTGSSAAIEYQDEIVSPAVAVTNIFRGIVALRASFVKLCEMNEAPPDRGTTVVPAVSTRQEPAQRADKEIDLWWGSYAGRAMAPSFAVCGGLTVVIYCGVHWWVPERGWLQFTFAALTGAVWLVQVTRWGYRFFTCNYRLTTRFLYSDRGLRPLIAERFAVAQINRVEVHANAAQKWLGIGDVWVWFDNAASKPAVLRALAAPQTAAETVEQASKTARETAK